MKKFFQFFMTLVMMFFVGNQALAAAPSYRVVGERVVELTYDEFDEQAALDVMAKKYDMKLGGCSAIKVLLDNKVYVGRNYDFYDSNSPALIVRNNSGKYRTIAIGCTPSFSDWTNKETYRLAEHIYKIAPFVAIDVMNEAGIYAETNIRPFEEQFNCRSTNPGKERRITNSFMQTMLSRYGTLDEIIAHINDYDWYDIEKMGFEQSFFLTDSHGRSIIVEFAENQCRVQDAEYNANYYLNNEWYAKERLGCGEQRISRELAYKPYVRSEADIFKMMSYGFYEQFYNGKAEPEYALPEILTDIGYDKDKVAADPKKALKVAKEYMQKVAKYSWQEHIAHKNWETVFCNISNVTDKVFNVTFSEHYKVKFRVDFEKSEVL